MPTLEWIGKDKVVNHDKEVPFRLLKEVRGKSLRGDNLTPEKIAIVEGK